MKLKAWHTFLFIFLAALVVVSIVSTVSIGATDLPFREVYGVIADKVFHGGREIAAGTYNTSQYKRIWQMRLARTPFAL